MYVGVSRCDRCGDYRMIEKMWQVKVSVGEGPDRRLNLCGACAFDLNRVLDEYLVAGAEDRMTVFDRNLRRLREAGGRIADGAEELEEKFDEVAEVPDRLHTRCDILVAEAEDLTRRFWKFMKDCDEVLKDAGRD